MHSQAQSEIIKLAVSWTLIGAIIFTVIFTLLSLAGLFSFSDHRQRLKLIYILVAQIAIVGITFLLGLFRPAPGAAINKIELPLKEAAAKLEHEKTAALAEQDRLNGKLEEAKRRLAESIEKAAADDREMARTNAIAEAQKDAIAHLKELSKVAAPAPAIDNSEEIDALKAKLAKVEMELAESRQLEETLNLKLKDSRSKYSALEQTRREKERELQRAKVIGRVLAINPGWNFVVLNIGDKQGVSPDSTLLVLRGGAQIGKVRVKTIEPSQSIADVITSTLRRGVTVQPGDNVVFEEIRSQPAQVSQSAPAPGSVPTEPALPPLPALSR